jgi:hypothetical protein
MPDSLSSTRTVSRAAAAEVAPRPVREAITPCVDCGPTQKTVAPDSAPRS